MPELSSATLFTDGACSGNPGPGGWGAVLIRDGVRLELSGGDGHTTNNRMEMLAALRGLEELVEPYRVELWTDSQYLRNGITQWIHGWMKKGWRTSSGEAVKNEDLWRALWEQAQYHEIDWRWVRGHTGHVENERCDRLAVAAVERARMGDIRLRSESPAQAESRERALVAEKTASRSKRSAPMDTPSQQIQSEMAHQGRNLELKYASGGLDDIKRRAGTLGGKLHSRLSQDDQFYVTQDGSRLKLRREIRHLPDGQSLAHAELIRYSRSDETGSRLSTYEIRQVENPDVLHAELLRELDLGIMVRKGRELVLIGRTRLHLDTVAGLGTFVELELVLKEGEDPASCEKELEHLIRGLGLYGLKPEPRAYVDLLAEKLAAVK